MANRATKFVSAIVVSAVVGIPVSTFAKDAAAGSDTSTPDSSTPAASSSTECLTTPNRESPQGQHWFYRMEPGTNRRCWFLRDQAERASQTVSPRASSSQSPFPNVVQPLPAATPPAPKTFSKNAQASRSLSNAGAESGARSTGVESNGLTVPKTPVFITTGSAGTNRGASAGTDAAQGTSAALSSSGPMDASIAGSSPDATAADGPNTSSNLNTGLSASSASEIPGMANMPQEKPSASLQVLFLVILGALAFAGIIASLTHRMPRIWRRRYARSRRHSIWRGADGGRRGPWAAAVTAAASPGRNQDRRPTGAQRDDPSGQIKRFLTQIVKQPGGKSKKRAPAKPQAAPAARVRTPSAQRGARASAVRP
jgi:hypothetical protein